MLDSLGFLSNPMVIASSYKFFLDQPMPLSFHGIDKPLASVYDLKSGKFHLVIYKSMTIHYHPSMGHMIDPKALCFLVVQNNQSF